MRAILEFDRDNSDDEAAFQRAARADAMCSVLWKITHGEDDWTREEIMVLLADEGINIEELWK